MPNAKRGSMHVEENKVKISQVRLMPSFVNIPFVACHGIGRRANRRTYEAKACNCSRTCHVHTSGFSHVRQFLARFLFLGLGSKSWYGFP